MQAPFPRLWERGQAAVVSCGEDEAGRRGAGSARPLLPWVSVHFVRQIVVGTDLSHDSERAVFYAAELAKALDASLVVVHVDEKAAFVPGSDLAKRELEEDREQLAALVRQLGDRRVQARALVRPGIPADGLCEAAREEEADLLVVGGPVRSRIPRIGSVTERIMRSAPCPVVVVPDS